MPQRNSSRRFVLRLVLFTLAGWLLWALGRNSAKAAVGEAASALEPKSESPRARSKDSGFSRRRLATTLAFTTLFFAGAAFSAGAGDLVVGAVEGSSDAAATSTDAAPADSGDAAPAEDQGSGQDGAPADDHAPESAPDPAPSGEGQSDDPAASDGQPADDPSAGDQPADGQPADGQPADEGSAPADSADAGSAPSDSGDGADAPSDAPEPPDAGPGSPAHAGDPEPPPPAHEAGGNGSLTSADEAPAALEFEGRDYGVVWFHRTLPDPTPPAKRLAPGFAQRLLRTSHANDVDWAFVLGVLRAEGHRGRRPASPDRLDALAARLHGLLANQSEWSAALALNGRTSFADRAQALTRYNRAVGLRALVLGLQDQKGALEQRVLGDSRIDIYAGGRDDIANHRVNVRVLGLLLYLAEAHGQVTVSCLISGHRLYARPGVVSAHVYGLAVDVAGLEGQSILGHQQAGGLTERAVRNILLLPSELQPKQVISLLGLGGPSFPLADHYDHIHVGY
jgi:hypothetical protein